MQLKRLLIFGALVLLLAACRVESPRPNGWGIVAVNPATGDVGVAMAGCGDYPLDYRAVLGPGLGAGLALGILSPLQRDRLGEWIEEPEPAGIVITRLKKPDNDPAADTRQYAVATLQNGKVETAVFTGVHTALPNHAVQDAANGVIVLGNGLVSKDAVESAMSAYREPSIDALVLSDRLLRGLEAGSRAGGVQACNQNGLVQTASTAFIMVARHGEPYFTVGNLGGVAANEPQPPWLALSVREPIGGRNALLDLRQQYEAWRSQNLPACQDCNLAAISFPPGGTRAAPADAWLQVNALRLVVAFLGGIALSTLLWFSLRPHHGHSLQATDTE